MACGITAFTLLCGCGKKGPLIYPDLLLPEAPVAMRTEQFGNSLKVSMDLPGRNKVGKKVAKLGAVKLERRESALSEQDCRACPAEFMLIKSVDLEYPAPAELSGTRLAVVDTDLSKDKQYHYRAYAVLKDGGNGQPSAPVAGRLYPAPARPVIKGSSQVGSIRLLMDLQTYDGEFAELQIFKSLKGEPESAVPTFKLSSAVQEFEDSAVLPGKRYQYAVRVVFRKPDNVLVYSELSEIVELSGAE